MGRDRTTAVDALVAALLCAVSLSLAAGPLGDGETRAVAAALAVAHIAPLTLRRRHPVPVLLVMVGTGLLSVPLGIPVVVLGPGILVAVYTVSARCPPATSARAAVAATTVMAFVVVANGMDAGTVVTNAVGFATAWWLGDRSRRAAAETEVQRQAAVEVANRAAAAERVQIARELHDVVAHALSVIAVQAGTGRFVIDESPAVARDALATIEATSRSAMQEMRRLLSVLRDDAHTGAGLLPAPGLDELESLVAGTEDAGISVTLRVEGERRELPAGVDLCAYRIVQEALTNVRKHAGATSATVSVRFGPSDVVVEVADDGAGDGGAAPVGGGHGLVGMRERAQLYGGVLEAGGGTQGGYVVRAAIPLADGT